MTSRKGYIKNIINEMLDEYYPKTKTSGDKKQKKYPSFKVRKVEVDDGNGGKKELAWFSLEGLTKNDAWNVKNTLGAGNVQDFHVKPSPKYPKGYTKYSVDFPVGFAKATKWIDIMVPKITTILEGSNEAEYDKNCLDKLAETAKDEFINCPSEAELRNAEMSLNNLKEEIYKAIQNGKFDDAMKIFNYSIELRARVYGHQLSPKNAAEIRAQATKAGLTPSDNGPDKYWPTFCRSKKTWEKWGRRVIDNPRMRYIVSSVAKNGGNIGAIDAGLAGMGWGGADKSLLGKQIMDKAGMASGGRFIPKGVMFDISDTEPIPGSLDDFAGQMGLINNLEGKLNDPALKKEEEIMATNDKNKADMLANADAEKKKQLELVATEEGKATVFMEAITRCINEGNYKDLNVSPYDKATSPIDNYLNTVYRIAAAKIKMNKWSNEVDVKLMAMMIMAGVAYQTVGAQRVKTMHPEFSACRFKDLGQFDSTVWPIMMNITSNINKTVGDIYNEKQLGDNPDATTTTNTPAMVKEEFFKMLERMNKINEEYTPDFGDMNEGVMNEEGGKEGVLNFLKGFGLTIGDEMEEM